MAPSNVKDKELYDKIHKRIKRRLKKQGRSWSLYASADLVRTYKKEYAKKRPRGKVAYSGNKPKNTGINRWFSEQWIDVTKLPKKVKCGRSDVKYLSYSELKKKYPYCRPSKRITASTPKTVGEISKQRLKTLSAKKRKQPKRVSKPA